MIVVCFISDLQSLMFMMRITIVKRKGKSGTSTELNVLKIFNRVVMSSIVMSRFRGGT